MPRPLHVGLVYGGLSSEHEISIRSARNVLAMLGDRHRVTPILITSGGQWLVQTPEALAMDDPASGGGLPVMLAPMSETCSVLVGGESVSELDLDVVFPILHGQNGEDGRVQGFLHTVGLPYVGPDVLGSAVCWDKDVAKRLLEHAGLPVTPYWTVRRGEDVAW
ncbi:MAG: D-alanine--D-alanine ligase A, partial [Bacteroidota bacterium]